MHLSTRLDCDLIAVESTDELTLLVELTAPTSPSQQTRAAATLQIVLDRSGSMAGDQLEGAKTALLALVERLDPEDNLGVVAFDDSVQIVVPAGPLTNKTAVKAAIAGITEGGSTDLSAGYLRGLQEVRRVAGPAGATLLLISDGHANAGVTDPGQLGKVAVQAQSHRITTSVLGFGLGYDERLLAALAQGGAGNELFAEESDAATALIAGEVDGLLDQVSHAASLRVQWTAAVASAAMVNDLPVSPLTDGFVVELGSFYSGETRRLLITLQIPGIAALGLAEVATLQLMHVSLPDLVQHTATLPIHVNVVPGDQAAGRLRDPEIRSEALFQQAQKSKRRASRLLSEGRVAEASSLLRQTSLHLGDVDGLPAPYGAELSREARVLDSLAEEGEFDSSRAAKVSSYSASVGSRTRGRQRSGGQILLRWASGHEDSPDATLLLEDWQVVRLQRGLDPALAEALRPDPDRVNSAEVANAIVRQLGPDREHREFFALAALQGGFTVDRA